MKNTKIYAHFGTIILLSSVISGCAKTLFNGEEQARPYEVRHPISLVKHEKSTQIPINTQIGGLDNIQKAKLRSFVYGFDTKGSDNMIISVPETGVTAASARKTTQEIVEIIESAGVDKNRITIGTYQPNATQEGNIKIEFQEMSAKGPDCSDMWSNNLTDAYNNTAWKGLGCSTRSNLATVISNPQDLEKMRKMGVGSASRRINVYDKYVLGQTTTASRGSEEKASATAQ